MMRLITSAAAVVLLGMTPALAAENSSPSTQSGVSPEAAKSAHEPSSGGADTSTGAKEQSSAPVGSGAASSYKPDNEAMGGDSMDTSKGAKEQSSAPPGSSAADSSKPNPTLGATQAPNAGREESKE